MQLRLLALVLPLAGCAAPSTTLVNDVGGRQHCSASGFGVIGTTIALASYQHCMSLYEARGYRVPGNKPTTPASVQGTPAIVPTSALRSQDGKLTWSLPPGWVAAAAPASLGAVRLYAREPVLEGAAAVTTTDRNDVPDFRAYVEGLQGRLLGTLADATTTPIETLTVGGRDALRFEATSTVKGLRIRQQFTAVLGTASIVKLNISLPASRFAAERSHIAGLVDGLTEIATERGT